MNLADDRFDVRYDERAVEPSEMLERIRGMGFEPELVESSGGPTANPVERVAVDRLPADLRASFAEARRRGQLVLLDFTAPG